MEVKVYRKKDDGTLGIESHAIPPLVGNSVTSGREDRTTTESDSDSVDEVVEQVEVGPSVGVTICRQVSVGRGDADDPRRSYDKAPRVIVTPDELVGEVTRVDVDGEQVWPEEGEDDAQPAPTAPPKPAPAPVPASAPAQQASPLMAAVAAQAPRAMADDPGEPGYGLSAADEDYIRHLIEDGLGL